MSSVLNNPTLVLNKHWRPIGIDTVKEAIKKITKDSCRFVNTDTYEVLDVVAWADLSPMDGQSVVHSAKRTYVAPEVVLLVDYDEMPKNEVRMTRRNVLVRDKYCCQYCGNKVARASPGTKLRKLDEYTLDHVVPKSQGGKSTWTNLVTACFKCNSKKRDRTPEQSHMHLLKVPVKPKWSLSLVRNLTKKPSSWEKFLSKETWNHEFVVEHVEHEA